MKILTGYYVNWEGKIFFEGLNLKEKRSAIQQKIGYLPESNPLYLDMTVADYLSFIAGLYGLKKPPLFEVMEQTGLEKKDANKIRFSSLFVNFEFKTVQKSSPDETLMFRK